MSKIKNGNLILNTDKGITFGTGPNIVTIYSPVITWDMDTSPTSALWSHGLSATEFDNIYEISANVRSNIGTFYTLQGGVNTFVTVGTSDAQANRDTGGQFNAAGFNAAELRIMISYIPD